MATSGTGDGQQHPARVTMCYIEAEFEGGPQCAMDVHHVAQGPRREPSDEAIDTQSGQGYELRTPHTRSALLHNNVNRKKCESTRDDHEILGLQVVPTSIDTSTEL